MCKEDSKLTKIRSKREDITTNRKEIEMIIKDY